LTIPSASRSVIGFLFLAAYLLNKDLVLSTESFVGLYLEKKPDSASSNISKVLPI